MNTSGYEYMIHIPRPGLKIIRIYCNRTRGSRLSYCVLIYLLFLSTIPLAHFFIIIPRKAFGNDPEHVVTAFHRKPFLEFLNHLEQRSVTVRSRSDTARCQ